MNAIESRSAAYNPFGKCDDLIKAMVPHEVKDEITRRRREMNMNESEFLRLIIMLYLYGVEDVMSIETMKINVLNTKGHESFPG